MATVISTTTTRIMRRTQSRSASTPPMPLPAPAGDPDARVVAVRVADPAAAAVPTVTPSRVHIVDHPAAQHALTVLCNRHASQYSLRASSNHLLVLLTLEAMRTLPTRPLQVETSREKWDGVGLAKPVVLLAVSRNGLSLSHNLMDCVPGLLVGSVTLNPSEPGQASRARLHLAAAPALRDCRVLLFDPVVQTGSAASAALGLVHQLGATDISLLSFSTSAQGLMRLQAAAGELSVWTAHVDREWDPKRATPTTLGDLGTRLFA